MNKYRDDHLDDAGVVLLDKIIAASNNQPVEALAQLDRMLQAYPASPQLWISKSIVTPATYISDRRQYCEKAINLNYQFFNGWYFLAKNQRLSATTYCSSSNPSLRLKFNQQLVEWIQTTQKSSESEDDRYFATIRHFAAQDNLFTDDWQKWYTSAIYSEEVGLSIASLSYSSDEINQFANTYEARNTKDIQMQKFWIMVELLQTFGLK